jgi:hypothetical protein
MGMGEGKRGKGKEITGEGWERERGQKGETDKVKKGD